MVFISAEDFLDKVKAITPLTREQTTLLACQMKGGDETARDKLVQGYLPFAASFVRRAPRRIQTLATVYACIDCVEKSVDRFDFSQDRTFFAEDLGRRLRRCMIRCLITGSAE